MFNRPFFFSGNRAVIAPVGISIIDRFGGLANANSGTSSVNLTAYIPDSEVSSPVKVWGKTGDLILDQRDANGVYHNNQLSNNNGEAAYAYVRKFQSDDQIATMYISQTSHVTHYDDTMGLMLRADSSTGSKNGYECRVNFNQNTFEYYEIYSWVAGTGTLVYQSVYNGGLPITPKLLEFSVIGSILTLRRNGVVLYSSTNETITANTSRRDFVLTAWNTDNTKSNNYIEDVTAMDLTSYFNNYGRLIQNISFTSDSVSTPSGGKIINSRRVSIGQNGALSMMIKRVNVNDSFGGVVNGGGSALEFPNGTQLNVALDNGTTYSYTCSLPFTMLNNTWYNLIMNRKDGYTKIYLNGLEETTYGGVSQQGYYFYIDVLAYNFIGEMKNVRVYAETLSDADIASLAANTEPQLTPLHRWKMDEGSGLLIKDYGIYDIDAHKFLNASRGAGDTPVVEDDYAIHELLIALKAAQLVS